MKHNLFSRFIGVLLAVVMLASLMSMPSLANTVPETDTTVAGQTQAVEQDQTVVDGTDGEKEEETNAPSAEGDEDTTTVEDDDSATTPAEGGEEGTTPAGEGEGTTPAGNDGEEGTEPSEGGEEPAEPAEDSTEGSASSANSGETTGDGEETAEPADIEDLTGEALLDALLAIEDDETLSATVAQLTTEQVDSLEALGEDALWPLAERLESQTSAPSESVPVDTSVAAPFTTVGPILGIDSSLQSSPRPMMRSLSLYQAAPQSTYTKPVDGLLISKNVDDSGISGIYKIDLHAEAESNIVSTAVPCDIILVLDRSGSMRDDDKDDQMITAAKNFVDTVARNSPDSRVAVVGYATNADILSGTSPENAFLSVRDDSETLKADINGATGKLIFGSTYSNTGLEQAWNIFTAVPEEDSNYNNARVVVMFTDGEPGYKSGWDDDNYRTAQNAIYWGQVLKGAKGTNVNVAPDDGFYGNKGEDFVEYKWVYSLHWEWVLRDNRKDMKGSGATIYTVGLGLSDNDVKVNEYMYRLSSNRPDGTHVSEWPEGGYTDERTRNLKNGYYLTTSNAGDLNNIFQQIAEQTGKPIENATIKDYISPYFQLVNSEGKPLDLEPGNSVQSGEYTGTFGEDEKGVYVEWEKVTLKPESADGNTPAEKFDATLYIKPKDAFMGGDKVPTNVYGPSGVYDEDGNCIGSFDECTVDVPVKGDFTVEDQSIYLSQSADPNAMVKYAENGARPGENLGYDAKSNDFVTITYTITGGGKTGTYTVPAKASTGTLTGDLTSDDLAVTECTSYTVTCKINNQAVNPSSGDGTAAVHIYTPTVTWKDSTVDYNTPWTEINPVTQNNVECVWNDASKNTLEPHTSNMPTTNEPDLDYEFTYNPVQSGTAITQETVVTVTSTKIGDKDYTELVDHVWSPNGDCSCEDGPDDGNFTIHLSTGSLTITKTFYKMVNGDKVTEGVFATGASDSTFLFEVKSDSATYYVAVDVINNSSSGSAVLKNIPAGSYTVSEIAWPNGYEGAAKQQVEVNGDTPPVEFADEVVAKDYTHDDSVVINNFTYDDSNGWQWTKKTS